MEIFSTFLFYLSCHWCWAMKIYSINFNLHKAPRLHFIHRHIHGAFMVAEAIWHPFNELHPLKLSLCNYLLQKFIFSTKKTVYQSDLLFFCCFLCLCLSLMIDDDSLWVSGLLWWSWWNDTKERVGKYEKFCNTFSW